MSLLHTIKNKFHEMSAQADKERHERIAWQGLTDWPIKRFENKNEPFEKIVPDAVIEKYCSAEAKRSNETVAELFHTLIDVFEYACGIYCFFLYYITLAGIKDNAIKKSWIDDNKLLDTIIIPGNLAGIIRTTDGEIRTSGIFLALHANAVTHPEIYSPERKYNLIARLLLTLIPSEVQECFMEVYAKKESAEEIDKALTIIVSQMLGECLEYNEVKFQKYSTDLINNFIAKYQQGLNLPSILEIFCNFKIANMNTSKLN